MLHTSEEYAIHRRARNCVPGDFLEGYAGRFSLRQYAQIKGPPRSLNAGDL
jgi:hypothetical protein